MPSKSDAPRPAPVAPPCPRDFDRDHRRVWKRVCRTLADMRLIAVSDWGATERYVRMTVQYRRCSDFLAAAELTRPEDCPPGCFTTKVDGSTRYMPYPASMEMLRLGRAMQTFEDRFGLNPLARRQLVADTGPLLHDGPGPDPETYFFAPRPGG
ncbi:MAG: P27 family phage terminase small subunit [Gemmataceae bacterium]